jgi:hypothetical protein
VYLGACAIPSGGLFRPARFRDIHVYRHYGDALLAGHVPYRDFPVEYPPGAVPLFALPSLLPGGAYDQAFKALMALCGLAAIFAVTYTLIGLGASSRRVQLSALFLAVSPVALGPVSLNTYDLWPAALSALALAALAARRPSPALALLGVAFAAKLYPLVLAGPALLYVWRARGRVLGPAAAFVAAAAVFFVPFAALGADGLGHSLRLQLGRGLHAESLGASLVLAGQKLGLWSAQIVVHPLPPVSRDVSASGAHAVAIAAAAAAAAAALLVWLVFPRGRADLERLVTAFAAAATGFLAFGKVFSPQYAEWLIPLVPLVASVESGTLLLAALVLAQTWYFHYPRLWAIGWPVWPLLVRNLLLVALYALLANRLKTRIPSSSKTSFQLGFRRRLTRSFAEGSGEIRSR